MGEAAKKKGLFGKVISIISGKPADDDSSISNSTHGPQSKEPVDLGFVKKFTESGGKFLYCEKEDEAYDFLKQIVEEASISALFCLDSNLKSIIENSGLDIVTDEVEKANAFCSSCEFLISFNGGIMISEKQTMGRKLSELPETFVTIARTSQIVGNLREGLTGIRQKYTGGIPAQITTIKGLNTENDSEEESGDSSCKKDIFLLLLEDQLE